jgi:hypothetical protein
MTDIKPKSAETLPPQEIETFEKESEGLEIIERKPERVGGDTSKQVETLEKRIKKEFPGAAKEEQKDLAIKKDIEERMETIIGNFVRSAAAADFNDETVEKILEKARMYIAKGYPNIADEVHDRILEAKNRGM